ARLWLAQGRLLQAVRWARDRAPRVDGRLDARREPEYTTLARVLIAQGKPSQALGLLERLLQAAEAEGRPGGVVEILALRAPALYADGARSRALTVLQRALALAEPEGYVRTFVDEGAPMLALLTRLQSSADGSAPAGLDRAYLARLLDAFGSARGSTVTGGGAPAPRRPPRAARGEREREVLRLLAAGLSNGQIARELVVAVGTVKWHVKNIYAKLQVHNRTQAVARATELQLLPFSGGA